MYRAKGIETNARNRPGISSLKGQGHFHFAMATFIGKSVSQWETFEGGIKAKTRGNAGNGLHCLRVNLGLLEGVWF